MPRGGRVRSHVPQTEPSIKSEKHQYHGCYDEHERRHRAPTVPGSLWPWKMTNMGPGKAATVEEKAVADPAR